MKNLQEEFSKCSSSCKKVRDSLEKAMDQAGLSADISIYFVLSSDEPLISIDVLDSGNRIKGEEVVKRQFPFLKKVGHVYGSLQYRIPLSKMPDPFEEELEAIMRGV